LAYKVVPFTAGLKPGQGAEHAAAQLESLANDLESQGWKFRSLESLETVITTPAVVGSSGCLGLGATPSFPETHDRVQVYAAVFEK
jgi:hypothetical protein